MDLNLTADRDPLIALVTTGVSGFANSAPSHNAKPITRVDIYFDLTTEQHPRVWIELDTEPTGEPQTGLSDTYSIADRVCYHWSKACRSLCEVPIKVIAPGHTTVTEDEESLCEAVGLFFVDLIKTLRDKGVFTPLRRAAKCYLGVGTPGGPFGWPRYEDRGPDNMV